MRSLLLTPLALLISLPAMAHITMFTGSFAPEAAGATGSGMLSMEYDHDGRTLLINATWAGLSGNTTTAHIHCCNAVAGTGTSGVALAQGGMLPSFPLGVTSGSYSRVIDLSLASQYGGAFLSGSGGTTELAEARLIENLTSGKAYFNIHTSTFGGGEIRSFVAVSPVPEPATYALMLGGLGLVGWMARRRR